MGGGIRSGVLFVGSCVTAALLTLAVGCAGVSGSYSRDVGGERVTVAIDGDGRVTVGGETAGGPWGFAVDLAELAKQLDGLADADE